MRPVAGLLDGYCWLGDGWRSYRLRYRNDHPDVFDLHRRRLRVRRDWFGNDWVMWLIETVSCHRRGPQCNLHRNSAVYPILVDCAWPMDGRGHGIFLHSA